MDCLVLPVSMLRRRSAGSRLGYQPLLEEALSEPGESPVVTVVVGRERREFLVDPFVLEESPFRVLINSAKKQRETRKEKRVVLVDVDSILFEHLLWLLHNDSTSLFQLNLRDIIDFYAQDF